MYPVKKTIHSLFNANLVGVMLICAASALIIAAIFALTFTWFATHLITIENKWFAALFTTSIGILTGVGGWFMLPSLIVVIAGFFQDTIIRHVEQKEYPHAASRAELAFWPEFLHDLRFTAWSLLLNLLILPFYLVGVGFVISVALNGYLIGREFFESVAGYHLGKAQAKILRRQHRKVVFSGGLALTLLTLVPGLNLFAPVIAVIWMVHVYQALPGNK
ncbi:hypothetical protein U14_00023 [Candidatus Moduliflexus flocculans]|uniref:CysZ-like protein n=1 Tax=Candidatus Moduliflexus flocculans TaxID=1499966 RepID=A0A0S6VT15_9BACT|nr:hypothetical protein U14_00023 [Candidatus Moduliflexus flocculans]